VNICVCGWHGREYDKFYMHLYKANKTHPVTVIAKKRDTYWWETDLRYEVIANDGLEWAAYNYYLENMWNGGDVLFIHDDVTLLPVIQDGETKPVVELFDEISKLPYDQAYLFQGRVDDVANVGHHGRALFVSAGLMEWLKPRGIWYDVHNHGYTGGKKPDGPVRHYNEGTRTFNELMTVAKRDGYNVLNKVYVPALRMGHRGILKDWEELL